MTRANPIFVAFLRRARRALAVAVVTLGAAAGAEEQLPWDGRGVLTVAKELQAQTEAVASVASRNMPQGTMAQRMTRDAAVRRMNELEASVAALVTPLVQAQGPDTTKPLFDAVHEKMREARRWMRESKPSPRLRHQWPAVEPPFLELARFYGVDGRDTAE